MARPTYDANAQPTSGARLHTRSSGLVKHRRSPGRRAGTGSVGSGSWARTEDSMWSHAAVMSVAVLMATRVAVAAPDAHASAEALATLKLVLAHRPASLTALADQPFARIALTGNDAAIAHT